MRNCTAFLIGWWFGVGFFGGGLYWLTNAFLVHADKHGWLIPIAVPGLAAIMGLFIGVTSLLAHVMWRGKNDETKVLGRILLFAVAWTVMEWVRSWIFTGFPWNLISYTWSWSVESIQILSLIGTYALSLISITFFCIPFLFFQNKIIKKNIIFAFIFLIVFFGNYL
ncbi:MAG: hypothetical protein JKY61_07505, partial [Planctomycetes bacterium]|nr:hypothetical protein [Planctomycetota bacterium]